jgi:hypothetical protein
VTGIVDVAAYRYRSPRGHSMIGLRCCDCNVAHSWHVADAAVPVTAPCNRGAEWYGKHLRLTVVGDVNSILKIPAVSLTCAVIGLVRALLRRLAGAAA